MQNASLIALFIADSTCIFTKTIQNLYFYSKEQIFFNCLALFQGIVNVEDIVLYVLWIKERKIGCCLLDIDIV